MASRSNASSLENQMQPNSMELMVSSLNQNILLFMGSLEKSFENLRVGVNESVSSIDSRLRSFTQLQQLNQVRVRFKIE